MTRKALGRGLRALIPGSEAAAREAEVRELPVSSLRPNERQPRRRFDEVALRELSESIREHGVLEPLVVRPVDGGYEIVIGERRWRASQLAGIERVPVVIRSLDDREATEVALVENLQREDLNPIEEAEAYQRLIEEFGMTQEEVARRVGRDRSTVANRLRLLSLEPEVKALIESGSLSAGHAKALLGAPYGTRATLARRIIDEGLSVRQVEELVRGVQGRIARKERRRREAAKDPHWEAIEEEFRQVLGTKVNVVQRGGRGRIEIEFYDNEDLERILSVLRS